jgi:toxin ParE1/3/4
MKVLMLAAAEQELLDAAYHYETATEGLGADFVAEFVRVKRVLAHSHQIGEKLDPIHRRARLRRFPYGLVYRCQGDVVKVWPSLTIAADLATGSTAYKNARRHI